MKKVFIVSAVLLLIIAIMWAVWFFVLQKTSPQKPEPEPAESIVDAPQDRTNALIRNITSTPVRAFKIVAQENSIRLWDAQDDTIYDLSLVGTNKTEKVHIPLPHVQTVSFSPDGNGVLAHSDQTIYTYFFDTQDLQRLNEHIDYAVWAQDSQRILYKFYDAQTKKRTLNVAQPNQTWTELATLPYRHARITQIPQSILIAFWPAPSAFTASALMTVSSIGPTDAEEVFGGLYGADYAYAPDGKHILIGSTLDRGGKAITLGMSNATGGEYVNFHIPTLVSKTVWSKDGKVVYYALPNDFPELSILPNDWAQKKFLTRDTFWKLDTTTGETTRIIPLEDITEKIDATSLALSPAEDTLYFINRINGLLYMLAL